MEAVAELWSAEAAAVKDSAAFSRSSLSSGHKATRQRRLNFPPQSFLPFCTVSPDASKAASPKSPLQELAQAGGLC